jgi:PTH1 family peptidyl-tRNA hydrolase
MNLSGIAVQQVLEHFPVSLQDILVVVDDFQLPFGTLRFRKKGSAGGHNGLKSIIATVGSEAFARLRIGIGDHFEDAVDFVLSEFSEQEIDGLKKLLPIAYQGITVWVREGIEQAMSQFNRQFLETEKK